MGKYTIKFSSNNPGYPGIYLTNNNKRLEFDTLEEAKRNAALYSKIIDDLVSEYYYGNTNVLNNEALHNILVAAVVSTNIKDGVIKKHYHLNACISDKRVCE